jgi:hypothetical protein
MSDAVRLVPRHEEPKPNTSGLTPRAAARDGHARPPRPTSMIAKGLSVREVTVRLKVGKTALYEALRAS